MHLRSNSREALEQTIMVYAFIYMDGHRKLYCLNSFQLHCVVKRFSKVSVILVTCGVCE